MTLLLTPVLVHSLCSCRRHGHLPHLDPKWSKLSDFEAGVVRMSLPHASIPSIVTTESLDMMLLKTTYPAVLAA